jgi:hypothetical protein
MRERKKNKTSISLQKIELAKEVDKLLRTSVVQAEEIKPGVFREYFNNQMMIEYFRRTTRVITQSSFSWSFSISFRF